MAADRSPRAPTTVIVPTTAEAARAATLERALRSILADQDPPGIPLVVVNGNAADLRVLAELRCRRDIRLLEMNPGSFPAALNLGRRQVDTPSFCFLDDDDLYYPGALRERAVAFERTPEVDVFITQGLRQLDGQHLLIPDPAQFDPRDLFTSLCRANWLPSCGGFYRTAAIGEEFFDPNVHHLEWTYVAFRLVRERSVALLTSAHPHYLVSDTLASASKSDAYLLGGPPVYERMLAYDLEPWERRLLLRRFSATLHQTSEVRMNRGEMRQAWRDHLRSLSLPGGLRYLAYSRHLVAATARKLFRRSGEP